MFGIYQTLKLLRHDNHPGITGVRPEARYSCSCLSPTWSRGIQRLGEKQTEVRIKPHG